MQIIKQPDGKYALFENIVDDFVLLDATREQVIKFFIKEERARIVMRVNEIFEKLDSGQKPYFQFQMTFKEACDWRDKVHAQKD